MQNPQLYSTPGGIRKHAGIVDQEQGSISEVYSPDAPVIRKKEFAKGNFAYQHVPLNARRNEIDDLQYPPHPLAP